MPQEGLMQNKVGDNAPSAKVMAGLVEQLAAIVEQMKSFGITLPKDDRKRLLHARRDADPMVQRVHDLAVKHGVTIKDIPLDGMQNDKALRARLHPLADLFRAGLTLAEDTEGQAESEMWEAFLAYYGVLANMAQRTPELAVELAPVIEFMAHGKRRAPPA
jgi:hypothetical protein